MTTATSFELAAQSVNGGWVKIGTIKVSESGRCTADEGVKKFFPAKTKGRENAFKSARWIASEGAISADWQYRRLMIRTAKV